MPINILIVDDESDIRNLIQGILEDEGYSVQQAENAAQVNSQMGQQSFALVILDIWLQTSEHDGLKILESLKLTHPDLPVIMISGHGTIETAVKAIKMGAYDFIEKPFKTDRLLLMVTRALEAASLRRENAALKKNTEVSVELIGKSHAYANLMQILDRVAQTGSRVLISGAAGAGKEIVARYIHTKSARASGPFIALGCAGLQPDTIDTELFGSEQGGKIVTGVLERAHGGTLLLDEVADMPLPTQAKILKVLQEQSFTRAGGHNVVQTDVRILASTSLDLEEQIEEGRFREDLYYRLNVVPVAIPPLRDRTDDIPLLCDYFIGKAARKNGIAAPKFSEGAIAAFLRYPWPGNIRQLANLMEWIVVSSLGQKPLEGADAAEEGAAIAAMIQAADLPPEISGTVHAALKGDWQTDLIALPLRDAREVFEREYLLAQIVRFGGNISRTAQFVGMERSALHRKLKSLGIHSSERDDSPDTYETPVKARA
ncbi:MAG: sigma-54 dependent transcriptional regulator [Pseudobdellovibrionaceae bacterium]